MPSAFGRRRPRARRPDHAGQPSGGDRGTGADGCGGAPALNWTCTWRRLGPGRGLGTLPRRRRPRRHRHRDDAVHGKPYRPVLPRSRRRDQCDAMVACMSAGEVVRLTRMGRLRMNGDTGAIGLRNVARFAQDRQQRRRQQMAVAGCQVLRLSRAPPRICSLFPGDAVLAGLQRSNLVIWCVPGLRCRRTAPALRVRSPCPPANSRHRALPPP